MGNWRFGAFPKLPYSTMQQLNLDWILDRIRRFLPDTGTKGQVLTRTKDGAAWVDPEAASGAVSSVNGKTGAVVLTASDVGALPSSYQAPVTSVNGMTGDVVISGGGAVDSVNGQTGEVVLTAADVGALPESYVPPAAPVQSVNGKTGAVVLDADDVGALPDTYKPPVTSVNGQTGDVVLNEITELTLTVSAGSNVSVRGCDMHRYGNLILGYVYFDALSSLSNNDPIVALASRLPNPVDPYAISAVRSINGDFSLVSIERGKSNEIRAWGPIPAGEYYYAQFLYVTRE